MNEKSFKIKYNLKNLNYEEQEYKKAKFLNKHNKNDKFDLVIDKKKVNSLKFKGIKFLFPSWIIKP